MFKKRLSNPGGQDESCRPITIDNIRFETSLRHYNSNTKFLAKKPWEKVYSTKKMVMKSDYNSNQVYKEKSGKSTNLNSHRHMQDVPTREWSSNLRMSDQKKRRK